MEEGERERERGCVFGWMRAMRARAPKQERPPGAGPRMTRAERARQEERRKRKQQDRENRNFSSVEEIGGSWKAMVVILTAYNATNRARCHGKEGRSKGLKTSHDDC